MKIIINNNNDNDNNKGRFFKFWAPLLLKIICRNCNTRQVFGFAGMFPKIIYSHCLFYFKPKLIDDCSYLRLNRNRDVIPKRH